VFPKYEFESAMTHFFCAANTLGMQLTAVRKATAYKKGRFMRVYPCLFCFQGDRIGLAGKPKKIRRYSST
jgi:hypothetical protein